MNTVNPGNYKEYLGIIKKLKKLHIGNPEETQRDTEISLWNSVNHLLNSV